MNGTGPTRAPALAAIACAVIACAAALGACGSEPSAANTAPGADQALVYVRCLRSQGVPDFPDPSPGGRLPNIPSSIDPAAPAFRSAQEACARLIPGGSPSASASGSGMLQLLAIARCMRSNGLPGFPDPTSSPPPPPSGSRTGNLMGGPGAYLQLPPSSPALTRAAAACGFGIR